MGERPQETVVTIELIKPSDKSYKITAAEGPDFTLFKDKAPENFVSNFRMGDKVALKYYQQSGKFGPWNNVVGIEKEGGKPEAAKPNGTQAPFGGPDKSWQIFVTGVTQRLMQTGKYEAKDISMVADAALAAWHRVERLHDAYIKTPDEPEF